MIVGHVAQALVVLKMATQANSVAAWIANGVSEKSTFLPAISICFMVVNFQP
jgi:hypothetical protein